MVIVKLLGGLGNQLFMYAAARRLACIRNTDIKLDITDTGLKNNNIPYKLNHFNIKEAIANSDEILKLKRTSKRRFTRIPFKILDRILPNYLRTYIKERHFYFDPKILNLSGHVYLEGYWQSEKYFLDVRSIILKEVTLKKDLDDKNKEVADKILSCESVGVHLRRGYLVTDLTNFHAVCNLEYYYKAIEYLKKINNPNFFIFSDDPKWARENFKIPHPFSIIDYNDSDNDYKDLYLMSLCKHQIIPNSTFSWWAAWLNNNEDKIVIAPHKWFGDHNMNANTRDLIPDNWIRI